MCSRRRRRCESRVLLRSSARYTESCLCGCGAENMWRPHTLTILWKLGKWFVIKPNDIMTSSTRWFHWAKLAKLNHARKTTRYLVSPKHLQSVESITSHISLGQLFDATHCCWQLEEIGTSQVHVSRLVENHSHYKMCQKSAYKIQQANYPSRWFIGKLISSYNLYVAIWHDLDLRGSPDERHACRRTPQQCPESWSNETELLPKSGIVQIASNCQFNTSQKNGTDWHQPRFPSLNLLLWSLQNPLSSPQLDTPAISPKLWKPPNWAWPHWKRQIG